jgi:hypothetical protein
MGRDLSSSGTQELNSQLPGPVQAPIPALFHNMNKPEQSLEEYVSALPENEFRRWWALHGGEPFKEFAVQILENGGTLMQALDEWPKEYGRPSAPLIMTSRRTSPTSNPEIARLPLSGIA